MDRYAENKKLLRAVTRQQAKAFDDKPSHAEHNQPFITCQSTLTSNKDQYQSIFIIIFTSNTELIKKFTNDDDKFKPSNQFQPLSDIHSIATLTSMPLQQSELESIIKAIARRVDDQNLTKIAINTDLPAKDLFVLKWLLTENLRDRIISVAIHSPRLIALTGPADIVKALKTHHTSSIGGHMGI